MSNKYLIAYYLTQDGDDITITDSYGNTITSTDYTALLNFLYTPYKDGYSRELKFFWNIDDSLAPIFRLMPVEECIKLLSTSFDDAERYYYNRGHNFVIKGDNGYRANIYSLSNMIDSDKTPESASELLELAHKFIKACNNIQISFPMTLNSAIGMFESSMRGIELTPNISCIPAESHDILTYAKHCAKRQGWISNYKIGHFNSGDIYSYDVSGSYAYHLSRIRDYKNAQYYPYSKDFAYKNEIKKGDITGFFKVTLTIYDTVKVHPFGYIDEVGNTIYPTGTFDTYLTLEEVLAVYKYKLGTVTIISGWYIRFMNYLRPMDIMVNRIFSWRDRGDIENDLCKGILVGYVGKCNAQLNGDKTSKCYNPMISAWVYAQARLQVLKFIYNNGLQDDLVAVATDGVISTRQATVTNIAVKRQLGTWRENPKSNALILGAGWILTRDKKRISLTYDKAMELINSDLDSSHYVDIYDRAVTLYESVHILNDISQVGKITPHRNTLDITEIALSQDRQYDDLPLNGNDLLNKVYDSTPFTV